MFGICCFKNISLKRNEAVSKIVVRYREKFLELNYTIAVNPFQNETGGGVAIYRIVKRCEKQQQQKCRNTLRKEIV